MAPPSPTGPGGGAPGAPGSTLLLDEYLETGDPLLLGELLACQSEGKLKSLVEPLLRDPRPALRQVLFGYIADGCDRPRHRPLVKGLFKRAETAGDDELMAHFLVAFDRLARRKLVSRRHWDHQRGQAVKRSVLRDATGLPTFDAQRLRFVPAELRPRLARPHVRPQGTSWGHGQPGATTRGPVPRPPGAESRFSRATRAYLVRRALRHLRRLAFSDAARFRRTAATALGLYRDEHLDTPVKLLDSWGLVHLLYHGSPVLLRRPTGITVAPGHTLASLEPSPLRADLWQAAEGFEPLVGLLAAPARTVRLAAATLLRQHHDLRLRALSLEALLPLLHSAHEEVQDLAAGLVGGLTGLDNLPIARWLELLAIEHPGVLAAVCELVARHVTPGRLTLRQCLELASARTAPAAELGLGWAREKPVRSEEDLRLVLGLGRAPAPRVRQLGMPWVISVLEAFQPREAVRPAHLVELLDSPYADVRAAALALLTREPRFASATELWAALTESPHDDARAFLVAHLEGHLGDLERDAVRHLWAQTLLAVHRGSRVKPKVAAQLADRIVAREGEAAALLPLLGLLLRSVRPPERRTALAALARAAHTRPALAGLIVEALPELHLLPGGPAT